jgi:predicted AAA+ superfamily ATPase
MQYIPRNIEPHLHQCLALFPAVVLTGPRRAGKTFMLRNVLPDATYVQLENPDTVLSVKSDPRGFLDALRLPAIIDEVQEVPELFNYIRSRIDADPEAKGRWILTGSQEALLMQNVSESMAGRAAILRLSPFGIGESSKVTPFSGGYPEALAAGRHASIWYSSYLQTYLERDVRSILAVRDLMTFRRFLRLLATRHGQMLNKTDLAAPLGISVPTLTQWLNVLELSGIIHRVPPFYRNAGKRLVKTPKIYFADSGLLCHLLGIKTAADLRSSPFAGAVFEGFVISEVCKAQLAAGKEAEVYYFRDEQGLEVDLVLVPQAGRILLAECKLAATVTPSMTAPMRRLADCLAREGYEVISHLIHTPDKSERTTPTAGVGVNALSTADFIATLGKNL